MNKHIQNTQSYTKINGLNSSVDDSIHTIQQQQQNNDDKIYNKNTNCT